MHVTLYFTTLGGGGTERVLVRLSSEFARVGHKVDLVLMRLDEHAYADEIDSRVRVVNLRASRFRSSFSAFWRYLRRERPDAVISAGDIANGFAGWAGHLVRPRPVLIFTHHGSVARVFDNSGEHRRDPLTWLLRHSHRLADAIVGVSEGVAGNARRLPGVSPQTIHRIYNPSWHPLIEERARQPAAHDWLESGSVPVVVAVGRLEPVKDFPTLLEAFALVRERRMARLLILGEGSERSALERLVGDLGLDKDVLLPGFAENPFACMARASVFALSSRHEGLPTVLIEAMACGTAVVSTDCPTGPREILEDGRYGPLVPVGDAKALAAAIERQLDHPTPAETLRARAREFSAEASANEYLQLIKSLLEDRE